MGHNEIYDFVASQYSTKKHPFIKRSSRQFLKHASHIANFIALLLFIGGMIAKSIYPPLSLLFIALVYFLTGRYPLIIAVRCLLARMIHIELLMVLAAIFAIFLGRALEGSLLILLFSLSEDLESSIVKKASGVIHSLRKILPDNANVLNEDLSITPTPLRELSVGQIVLVRAGEAIPIDGKIIEGSSYIDLAHISGESIPVKKSKNEDLPAGAINKDGTLKIKVTKTTKDSSLAKILKLILHAQSSRPKAQKMIAQFGSIYSPIVLLSAIILAIFLPFISNMQYWGVEGSLYRALTYLIASSPCSLILAIPTAYVSAISACAKRGLLLRGGVVLELLAKCKRIGFDKTGTITTGKLQLVQISSSTDKNIGLRIAYSLEIEALHPLAEAIITSAKAENLDPLPTKDVKIVAGFGLTGNVLIDNEYHFCKIGNREFIKNDSDIAPSQGIKMSAYLSKGEDIWHMEFTDEIRKESKDVINQINEKGIESYLLTGDKQDTANKVGEMMGMDGIYAHLTPEKKVEVVEDIAKDGIFAMVGDGLNDAAALAKSHVGIAMGGVGNTTTIETSDVVLLKDNLHTIPWLIDKSRHTTLVIKQNLALSLLSIGLNIIFSLMGIIPLWVAVLIHEGSTILIVGNSTRLLR